MSLYSGNDRKHIEACIFNTVFNLLFPWNIVQRYFFLFSNFIASCPFSVGLFFLELPVWTVNVASSWVPHSKISVGSCYSEGRREVWMRTNVVTFPLWTSPWPLIIPVLKVQNHVPGVHDCVLLSAMMASVYQLWELQFKQTFFTVNLNEGWTEWIGCKIKD